MLYANTNAHTEAVHTDIFPTTENKRTSGDRTYATSASQSLSQDVA